MGGMRLVEGGQYGHKSEDSKVAASTAVCVACVALELANMCVTLVHYFSVH
jgi:hypothetical protein